MEFTVGQVLTGKVTGITKFGAFIQLAPGKSGLVHISEIANTYVEDISQHLTQGQSVEVKIISIDKENRINLSIKQAAEKPQFAPAAQKRSAPAEVPPPPPKPANTSFEDKLKQFMQISESKMSDLNRNKEKRGGSYRRSRGH